MAIIMFKAKVQKIHNVDNTISHDYIRVPKFTKKHCDMNSFRAHEKFGAYANSDIFPSILLRIRHDTFDGQVLRLDKIPENVNVDISGFLALVIVNV